MGRRPTDDPLITVTVIGHVVRLAQSELQAFPELAQFAQHLVETGRQPRSAFRYARRVAALRRAGKLHEPQYVMQPPDSTAVAAYWRWVAETYDVRVRPVRSALATTNAGDKVSWLRVGSLVPPYEGKTIPMWTMPVMGQSMGQPLELKWIPCNTWTLHVPLAKDTPPHQDPCAECTAVSVTEQQMHVIGEAYYKAWGTREPSTLPPASFLFGQPPLESSYAPTDKPPPVRIVGLLPNGPFADALEGGFRASVSAQASAFVDRVRERKTDVVVIDLELARARGVLDVIRQMLETSPIEETVPSPAATGQ